MHAQANPEAEDELIGDPLRMRRIRGECGDETSADRHDTTIRNHEGGVVPDPLDQCSSRDAGGNKAKDQRQRVDTGLVRADILDGLEPDGEIVYHYHHCSADAEL